MMCGQHSAGPTSDVAHHASRTRHRIGDALWTVVTSDARAVISEECVCVIGDLTHGPALAVLARLT